MKDKIHPIAKKLGYNSNESFYLDFPTQEDYQKFEMGGQIQKQKYNAGGVTPLAFDMPKSLTSAVPTFGNGAGGAVGASAGGAASGLGSAAGPAASVISAVPGLMKGSKMEPGPDKGKQVGKTIGSTAGGIAGGIAGSILLPGVGTVIGGMLGSTLGGLAGGGIGKMVGNQNQEFKQETNQFQYGGEIGKMFTDFEGETHEQGGATFPGTNIEVEKDETKAKLPNGETVIFSNSIPYKGKTTYAQAHRKIESTYNRPNDIVDRNTKNRLVPELFQKQETQKQNQKAMMFNNLRNEYVKYGGKMKFDGGGTAPVDTKDFQDWMDVNDPTWLKGAALNKGAGYGTYGPNTTKAYSQYGKDYETMIADQQRRKDLNLTEMPRIGSKAVDLDPQINDKMQDVPDFPHSPGFSRPKRYDGPSLANLAAQGLGDAYNIGRGLKGGDPVDFERVNPSFMYADPKPAMTALNNSVSTSFNNVRNSINNSGAGRAEKLAFLTQIAGQESLKRGLGEAQIKSEYDKMNTGTYNSIANQARSQNAEIQMRESDARQRETDAARSSVSTGLAGLGSKVGRFNNAKGSWNNQKDLVSLMRGQGFYPIENPDGTKGWKKDDGTIVDFNVGIDSVLNPTKKQ